MSTTDSAIKRVFSGIQPTGDFQLGNYIGAVKHWVPLANDPTRDGLFCVVDLHALTKPQVHKLEQTRTRSLAALLIAFGIDPNKSTLFMQSHVSAHAELMWFLTCVTPEGLLTRMTQYKDKKSKGEVMEAGILMYPVLMAADILLYDTHEVPVGDDQKQHVELARNLAEKFNLIFGDTFVVPEPIIPKVGARIMGLDDPSQKMSKSLAHIRGHAVSVLDDPKEIERSFMKAKTDLGNEIRFSSDPDKAGVNNLLSIYQVMTEKTAAETESEFANARGYGDLKKAVADVVIERFTPIKARHDELIKDPTELDRLLAIGAEKARAIADVKLREVKEKMGLIV